MPTLSSLKKLWDIPHHLLSFQAPWRSFSSLWKVRIRLLFWSLKLFCIFAVTWRHLNQAQWRTIKSTKPLIQILLTKYRMHSAAKYLWGISIIYLVHQLTCCLKGWGKTSKRIHHETVVVWTTHAALVANFSLHHRRLVRNFIIILASDSPEQDKQ